MEKIKDEINVMDYKYYVQKMANKYVVTNDERAELIQEGLIGVFEASKLFDPSFEISFISYSTYYIKKRMLNWLYNNKNIIRLPINIQRAQKKYNDITDPDKADLSEFTKKELQHVTSGWNNHLKSLDEPINDDGITLSELVGDDDVPDTSFIDERKTKLYKAIDQLKPEFKELIIQYYGLYDKDPKTLQQIGDEKGITLSAVSQKVIRIEKILKEIMTK